MKSILRHLTAAAALCFIIYDQVHAQVIKIATLQAALEAASDDTAKVNTLTELGKLYLQAEDFEQAVKHANTALQLAEKLNFKAGEGVSYRILGAGFYAQGNYPEALKCFLASLKLAEGSGEQGNIAKSYNNIGNVYSNQGNYPEACDNFLKALRIQKELGDKMGMAIDYNNLGVAHTSQGHFDEALKNHMSALAIRKEIGDKAGMAASAINIGVIYFTLKNYREAIVNFSDALGTGLRAGDRQIIETAELDLASVYFKQNEFTKAGKYLRHALKLAHEIGEKDGIQLGYYSLAKLDSALGDCKAACVDYKMFVAYRDSLVNEENTKRSVRLAMQYEFDKKEAADSVKAVAEKKIAAAQLESEHNKRYALYGGLAVVILFSGFIYNRFRVTRKQKQIIEEQKLIVEEQKKIVEEKNKEVLDSIHYARRIQYSLLPTTKYIERCLKK